MGGVYHREWPDQEAQFLFKSLWKQLSGHTRDRLCHFIGVQGLFPLPPPTPQVDGSECESPMLGMSIRCMGGRGQEMKFRSYKLWVQSYRAVLSVTCH